MVNARRARLAHKQKYRIIRTDDPEILIYKKRIKKESGINPDSPTQKNRIMKKLLDEEINTSNQKQKYKIYTIQQQFFQ
jgi:hypothetical protein